MLNFGEGAAVRSLTLSMTASADTLKKYNYDFYSLMLVPASLSAVQEVQPGNRHVEQAVENLASGCCKVL